MRGMLRTFAILLAILPVASAQIQDLATTADGGQTYFATAYRQKNSAQPGYRKIFRIAENGLELFRQLKLSFLYLGGDTNFYLAERPSVSGDGRMVAYTAARTCSGGSHCIAFSYNQGWLAGATDRMLGVGAPTVSPDGRSYFLFNNANFAENTPVIGDLQSGNTVVLSGYRLIGDGVQVLANGPVALLSLSNTPGLWKAGQFTPLPFKTAPVHARLNAGGDRIVYETSSASTNFELHSYSAPSGRDILLAIGGAVPSGYLSYQSVSYFHPSLTFDGKYVSYVLDNRLLIQSTDGAEARALTSAADGVVTSSVLSGWGNVAFAATSAGRLLRIDVATGARTELIAPVPHLEVTGGAPVPGGRIDVRSTGPAAGDPALIGAGADAPVVGRSENTVTLQIPWEARVPSTVTLVAPGNASLFEEAHDLELQSGSPLFYTLPGSSYALAAHQDFSGIVSDSNPARPGEIVHLYFTGLGAVSPAIATGSVTPVNPLFRLQTQFNCQFRQKTGMLPADIRFAGLAPGTIGVEQVDILVPSDAAAPSIQVECISLQSFEAFTRSAQLPIAP